MSKKVCVIKTSLRNNSNSDYLADQFVQGAIDSGHEVNVITLKGKSISFCTGCLSCQFVGKCSIVDDVESILEQCISADVLVFATPVYYYNVSGICKTLIDRLNPMFNKEYQFRDVYLIATAADVDENITFEATKQCIDGFVSCYEKAKLAGCIEGYGLTNIGEAQEDEHKSIVKKAYDMGKMV